MTYNEIVQLIAKLRIDSNNLRRNYTIFCGYASVDLVKNSLDKFDMDIPVIVDRRIKGEQVYLVKDWELRNTLEFDVKKIEGE